MSDLTTPQEILNLVKRISIDPRSSGRRHRILRGMVKRCFSRHPHLLDSFVDINGVEALVLLSHSSRPSAKLCGNRILKQLYDICMDLEEPSHGLCVMIELCKSLSEEDSVFLNCQLFLALTAPRWIKQEKSLFLVLVVNLFKGVDSELASHVKDPHLEATGFRLFRLYVLSVFSQYFELAGEVLSENMDIRYICYSLMEKMSILLPGFPKRSPKSLSLYFDVMKLVYSTAHLTGGLQEFRIFLTDRAEVFRKMIMMSLDKMGEEWIHNHGWVVQFMEDIGLEVERTLFYARSILPAINESTTFHLLIDRGMLLDCSEYLLLTATRKQLHGTVEVNFLDEIGYGDGLVREWFVLVAKELLEQKLLVSFGTDKRKILPTREAMEEEDMFTYNFAGRFIALAVMNKMHLGITFDRILYLSFAEREIGLEDFEDTDPELYLNWKKYRKDVENEGDESDLYVEESINAFLESISAKVDGLKKGFDNVTSSSQRRNFFQAIGAQGVDAFLLGDTEDISIKDWMNHTDYVGYIKADPQIGWFWKVVTNLSPEDRRDLLFFWTAVKFLPPGGFKGLPMRLCISRSEGKKGRLPFAATCFFQLNIPSYPSFRVLQERVHYTIKGSFGFHIE